MVLEELTVSTKQKNTKSGSRRKGLHVMTFQNILLLILTLLSVEAAVLPGPHAIYKLLCDQRLREETW